MKSIIICASTHHGNTRKVVDAIAEKFGVEVVDSAVVTAKGLPNEEDLAAACKFYEDIVAKL